MLELRIRRQDRARHGARALRDFEFRVADAHPLELFARQLQPQRELGDIEPGRIVHAPAAAKESFEEVEHGAEWQKQRTRDAFWCAARPQGCLAHSATMALILKAGR